MELDTTQKKLLKLLSINCRFTNKDIAKSLHVSPETVSYQTDKLVHDANLGSFKTFFDCRKLGYTYYHLFVRVSDIDKVAMDELARKQPVMMLAKVFGRYDLQMVLLIRQEQQLNEDLADILNSLKPKVSDYITLRYAKEHKWTQITPDIDIPVKIPERNTPIYSLNTTNIAESDTYTDFQLDETDITIIRELLDNPQKSYLQISQGLSVSRETVRNRIHDYVEDDFLLFCGLVPNYKTRGYFTNALLLKLNTIPRDLEKIIQPSYVAYATETTGKYNLLIYTIDRGPQDFANHARTIQKQLSDELLKLELLYFEERVSNVQFPSALLEKSRKN